jgi:hypothetical protein
VSRTHRVYLEIGTKRTFACSVDWPGWARSGRGDEQALETLAAYAPRFAVVAEEADLPFRGEGDVEVVERVPGSGTTDFGAPGKPAQLDFDNVGVAEARRQAALVRAAWRVFDRVVSDAPPTLRKGPRGGGRDRDAVARHVVGAEAAYARSIGVRHPEPDWADRAAIEALRSDIVAVLEKPWSGDGSSQPRKGWPPRYAARRIAWHVLDHAWEIEDKSS